MDISVFFQPLGDLLDQSSDTLGSTILRHTASGFPDLEEARIALIGVRSERGAPNNKGCKDGPDALRSALYKLSKPEPLPVIADLGNIEEGDSQTDTEFAIKESCAYLMKKGIIPIVIGGGHELTFGCYSAYEKLEHTVNMVTIDRKFDVAEVGEGRTHQNFLSHIVTHSPNILFNYANIGNQRALVNGELLELMEKMYFDSFRMGEVSEDIFAMEPVIRYADMVSFDISSIRAADAPGNAQAGPNGLSSQQACQLARYAGISDKLTLFGLFELNPSLDERGFTASLCAEMIWYFIEGVALRKGDYPACDISEYVRYIVDLENHQLVFYKSKRSNRWWMDVPYPAGKTNRYERHHLVPCTYKDYQQATNEELPDRWWKTYQKLV